MPEVGWVVYIDEAGDCGRSNFRPEHRNGNSEWLVLGAVLIRAERDREVVGWTRSILDRMPRRRLTHLHFRDLTGPEKEIACHSLADLPVRCFAMLSHKRNMRGYRNLRAEKAKVNRTSWFYVWMIRLLIEEVTEYCLRKSIREYKEPKTVRVELSTRGGLSAADIGEYFEYTRNQSRMGLLHISHRQPKWEVLDPILIEEHPNKMRAGLQLADVVASAFFRAVERNSQGKTDTRYARLLRPRVCFDASGRYIGHGVKVFPPFVMQRLPPEQRAIFDFYLPPYKG